MKELVNDYNKKKQDSFYNEKEQEFFNHEINILKETFKDINWKINKEFCNKIIGFEKPPAVINNLCEAFLYTLDQKDNSWNNFKVATFNLVGVIKELLKA
jgi:hypothetical protein